MQLDLNAMLENTLWAFRLSPEYHRPPLVKFLYYTINSAIRAGALWGTIVVIRHALDYPL